MERVDQLEELFKNRNCETVPIDNSHWQCTFHVSVNERLDALYDYLKDNIWFDYICDIYSSNVIRGDNWIDFESEISHIIQIIDEKTQNLYGRYFDLFFHILAEAETNSL